MAELAHLFLEHQHFGRGVEVLDFYNHHAFAEFGGAFAYLGHYPAEHDFHAVGLREILTFAEGEGGAVFQLDIIRVEGMRRQVHAHQLALFVEFLDV